MSLELQSLLPYPNSCVGASPHQQGRDTKMLSFCGIDVSKDRLDVMVLPEEQCCSVPNDASGWAALVERLRFIGPYLSQFLWLDIPYGIKTIEQRYTVPSRGQTFLTDYAEWLACQRGAKQRSELAFDGTPRFICSARELAEYVHRDFSFQAYMNAALIMLALGRDALSPTNPYRDSRTQFGDITLGSKNILSLVAQAALLGQKGAYFHKWQVHRRLRPECFGGRIETHATGRREYDLHGDILQCDAVARVRWQYGTRLLPAAFPEGCPTHPSYPAAHACNAGACATILKAFFDADYVLPHPVEAMADGSALEP